MQEQIIERKDFRVTYQPNQDHLYISWGKVVQKLFLFSAVDMAKHKDLFVEILNFNRVNNNDFIQLVWEVGSSCWKKKFVYLDIYDNYISYYITVIGTGYLDIVRFFEGTYKDGYQEHIYLTKHFNDRKKTPYREYSLPSPISFIAVLNPEPNTYTSNSRS